MGEQRWKSMAQNPKTTAVPISQRWHETTCRRYKMYTMSLLSLTLLHDELSAQLHFQHG